MKKFLSLFLTFLLTSNILILSPPNAAAQTNANPQTLKEPLKFGLPDGTAVKLRTTRNLSSGADKTGTTVDFEVLEDVKIGETVIVPRGGTALGTVTRGKAKGRFGSGGKLDITIDSVRLASGEKAALRAVRTTKGRDNTGAMTAGIVATGFLFFPAAPFFLFIKGRDITIPKGTDITAYINGDTPLDAGKFAPVRTAETASTGQNSNAGFSTVSIKSAPDAAEITIDGKFVGSTPSTVQLKAGEHKISVAKSGYNSWERTMTIDAGGSLTLNAELEKTP